jgi:hypothetical protein
MIEQHYTRRQVPRGTRPDAETIDTIYLIKNVSNLRATYQIRLLAFKAVKEHKKLAIRVPKPCRFGKSLKGLITITGKTIKREDI